MLNSQLYLQKMVQSKRTYPVKIGCVEEKEQAGWNEKMDRRATAAQLTAWYNQDMQNIIPEITIVHRLNATGYLSVVHLHVHGSA